MIEDLTPAQAKKLVLTIEKALRDQGLDPLAVTGVLGAAFASSLTEVPPHLRQTMITVHNKLLEQTLEILKSFEERDRARSKYH